MLTLSVLEAFSLLFLLVLPIQGVNHIRKYKLNFGVTLLHRVGHEDTFQDEVIKMHVYCPLVIANLDGL